MHTRAFLHRLQCSLFAAAGGYRPRSLEGRIFRGAAEVEEKSMLKRARYIQNIFRLETADLIVEVEIYFKCHSAGSLWRLYYNRIQYYQFCFRHMQSKPYPPQPISAFSFYIILLSHYYLLLYISFFFYILMMLRFGSYMNWILRYYTFL